MRTSSRAAKWPPIRTNSPHAGVAQSVAQLSCKQQVRGSSPLASSQSAAYSVHLGGLRPVVSFKEFHRPL